MIVEIVGERPSSRLLDVACGSGGPSLAIAFAMTSCHVTGVDIGRLKHSRGNHRAVGMGLNKRAEFRSPIAASVCRSKTTLSTL